jgi:hypothetical protein
MKKEQQDYNSKKINISIRMALIGELLLIFRKLHIESRNFFIFPAAADMNCYRDPTSSISDTAYIRRRNLGHV